MLIEIDKEEIYKTFIILADGEKPDGFVECMLRVDGDEEFYFHALVFEYIFTLEEIQKAVGGNISRVRLSNEVKIAKFMYVNEEFLYKDFPYNNDATAMSTFGISQPIMGRAVIIRKQ